MATITPHIVIFKASDYNLVWLLKDVTFTATHTSDSVPSDCFQRQMHCDEIMYSADVCSFNGDICQSATLGIILCTLYFNVRLWKDSKPSADNTSNMMRAKKQVEGRTQLCNLCSLVSHTQVTNRGSQTAVQSLFLSISWVYVKSPLRHIYRYLQSGRC